MSVIRRLNELRDADRDEYGGKAVALAAVQQAGFKVPAAVVISSTFYRRYLDMTGLAATLHMELGRKEFAAMRWEEIWDFQRDGEKLYDYQPGERSHYAVPAPGGSRSCPCRWRKRRTVRSTRSGRPGSRLSPGRSKTVSGLPRTWSGHCISPNL